MMRKRQAIWGRALIGAGLISVVFAPSAAATNFGSAGSPGIGTSDNGVWLTNNANWIVGRRDLTTFYRNGVTNAVLDEFAPTDLDPTLLSPDSCPDASYDVCAFDSNYGNTGWVGVNQCNGSTTGSHPNQRCSLAFNKYNLYYSVNSAKSLACEELGHSVGLRHRFADPVSCMSQQGDDLVLHDRNHINNRY
jgi:hypothetical protein